MKKLLILVTVLLSSCSTYRIQVIKSSAGTYYVPAQRNGLQWREHYHMFTNKQMAESQIKDWKDDRAFAKNNKSQYIYIK
jgi:hypothetical protein